MIQHRRVQTILYVDDTVGQRYAMRRILETEGFTVLEAGTAKEALAKTGPNVSLAVVDVRLPDMSGYDLSKKMKVLDPHLPILQVSASFSDPHLRAAGLSGGADAYIAQPVYPSELTALVRRMLRTSEAEDALRFLASVGPIFSSSLSTDETAGNIRRAMVPQFADFCALSIETGRDVLMWPRGEEEDGWMRDTIHDDASVGPRMLDSRTIVAPLSNTKARFGTIVFKLGESREYTQSDLGLAADLSNRAALAMDNCLLFASERSTREALIQSEKLATAGRMSAAIAHEINNPLEALTNLIYIIEQTPNVEPVVRETATAALAEVGRLAHIARQSLGFYRELRAPSEMDLSESVRDTVELFGSRIAQSKITVELALQEKLPVNGVKGEIRQVISNLLVNALEATPAGGKVRIETAARAGRAFFQISDDGPGVDEAIAEKIFEPFFTTKQGTGTGLGLWITQSIVEKHGGSLELRKEADGAAFAFDLPLSDGADADPTV